jgi:hypothetical protein
MSDNSENDAIRGAALARMFSKWAQPTDADRARALELTLRQIREDRYTNPQALTPEAVMKKENVQTAGATPVKTFGWADERKITSPSAKGSQVDNAIGGLADKFLGPATPGKPNANK